MMNKKFRTDRRKFLKGLGAAVSLPLFESTLTRSAFAAGKTASPVRLGVFFIPNGVNLNHWTPENANWPPTKDNLPKRPNANG